MSDIKDWASVAELNGEASPNGWPEGMPPSDVNNSAREMMAAMRRSYVRQPWYAPGGDIVRVSGSRITIKDDAKVKDYSKFYSVSQRIRVEGVEYTVSGHITNVSYQDPTTTIEVELDAEQTLPGTITDVYVGLSPADVQGVAGPNLLGCIIGFTEESSQLGAGLMHANGEKFSPTLYPDLANLYFMGNDDNGDPTYRYGREQVGDAWWPKRPDFRGYFPRFLDDREAPQEGQEDSDTRVDTNGPRVVGDTQGDAIRNLVGRATTGAEYMSGSTFSDGILSLEVNDNCYRNRSADFGRAAVIKIDASTGVPTAEENRPKNVAIVGVIVAYGGVISGGLADVTELVKTTKEIKDISTTTFTKVETLGDVLNIAGESETKELLPTVSVKLGDVYKVKDTGSYYIRSLEGTWDNIGGEDAAWGKIKGGLTEQKDLKEALDTKANVTDVYTKATVYNKTEVDNKVTDAVSDKADKTDTYTKSEVDDKITDTLSSKADKSDTYTKAETNAQITTALSTKADKSDTYTKTAVDNLLTTKADVDNTYTKSEVDEKIKNSGGSGGSGATSLSELAIAGDNIVFTDDGSGKTQISANLSSYVQNKTTKSRALAIGVSPYGDVSGSGSVSIGTAKATQQNALAIGADYRGASSVTQASGYRSIAIGTCYDTQGAAVASGNDSIAIGTRYTQASGSSGIAMGIGTTASGNNSALAIGAGAIASAAYAASYGAAAEAAGERTVAVGYYAKASAKNAVQLGTGTNENEATLQFLGYQLVNNEGNIPADRMTANLSRSLMETAQAGEGINIATNPVLNFTTVGTAVTVSDEYVASGFTGSSYLTTPMPLDGRGSDSWEIGIAFVVSSLSSQQIIFRGVNSDNSIVSQMRVNTNGTIFFGAGAASLTSSSSFSTGSKIYVKVAYDVSTSTYTMHTSTDGVTWSQQANRSGAAVTSFGTTINLGQGGTAVSLYLKNCYMSSAGTEIWRAVQGADKVQFGLNKSEVSALGMPSSNYTMLTLGATGSKYTAPANGYFSIMIKISTAQGFLLIRNESNQLAFQASEIAGQYIGFVMPAKKEDEVYIGYGNREPTAIFRFIYAEGEI